MLLVVIGSWLAFARLSPHCVSRAMHEQVLRQLHQGCAAEKVAYMLLVVIGSWLTFTRLSPHCVSRAMNEQVLKQLHQGCAAEGIAYTLLVVIGSCLAFARLSPHCVSRALHVQSKVLCIESCCLNNCCSCEMLRHSGILLLLGRRRTCMQPCVFHCCTAEWCLLYQVLQCLLLAMRQTHQHSESGEFNITVFGTFCVGSALSFTNILHTTLELCCHSHVVQVVTAVGSVTTCRNQR